MNTPSPLEIIFFAALQKGSPVERVVYLDEVCADDLDLRGQIEKMLAVQSQAESFLEVPAGDIGTIIDQIPCEKPGTRIGPYILQQQLGEGGMGTVFLAQQHEPVQRQVALKVIKLGMDTRQVIARFEAERQVLSLMEHPNIAKVLDAGTTETGRPYFVMELVKGQPITEYCDQHQLTPRQRLELFVDVGHAIQHAHQKGIIHRDIKPSNVLVAEYDEKPLCKVIDFGVAKALNQPLTEQTLFTGFGQLVGTPEYMSPEQTNFNNLDIDTRSDVYSLGVLLYELLTGSTPFDRERLRSAAWDEMLRIIREEEPPLPSLKLGSGELSASVSSNRGIEPARLSRLVSGELDWIVMRALEKDRSRRYATANSFMKDILRYLADEPVHACPPSKLYRIRKFARKHKTGVLVSTAMLLLLLTGMTGLAISNSLIRTEQNRTVQALKESDKQTDLARKGEARIQSVLNYLENDRFIADAWKEGGQRRLGQQVSLRQSIQTLMSHLEQGFHEYFGSGASTTRVATDREGNVFATGHFSGTLDLDPGAGIMELSSVPGTDPVSQSFDCWIAKYSSTGTIIWARRIGGSAEDSIGAITVDAVGNVYLGGWIGGPMDFDAGPDSTVLTKIVDQGLMVLKVDPAGRLVWAVSAPATNNSQSVTDLQIDSQGNVYAVGIFDATVDFDPGPSRFKLTSRGRFQDAFAWKLNANGDFVWVRRWGSDFTDAANSLTLDDANNIYVTGFFIGTADFDPGLAKHELTSTGQNDSFVVKLNAAGDLVWVKTMGGGGSAVVGDGISFDGEGHVYAMGHFVQTADFDPGTGKNVLSSNGDSDIFVSKLTIMGDHVWTRQMGGAGKEKGLALINDGQGNVLFTGSFQQTVDFDPGPGRFELSSNTDSSGAFVAKLNSEGDFIWAIHLGGDNRDEEGSGVAFDALGHIYVGAVINGGNLIQLKPAVTEFADELDKGEDR